MEGLSVIQRKDIRDAFKESNRTFESQGFYRVVNSIYETSLYGSRRMDAAYEEIGIKSSLSSVPRMDDKAKPHPVLSAPSPRVLTVRPVSYRGSYAYLWEDLQDDKAGYYREMAATLGHALLFTRELVGHEPFNRARDATFLQGWDNNPLGFATIPLLDAGAGTYSNVYAAAAPSETTLDAVMNHFDRVPDNRGRPTKVQRIILIVHITRLRHWRQLLRAAARDVAVEVPVGTGANANPQMPNRFSADNITVIGTPYFTAADLNSFIALGAQNGLYWRTRFTKDGMDELTNPPRTLHWAWSKFALGVADKRQIAVWGF